MLSLNLPKEGFVDAAIGLLRDCTRTIRELSRLIGSAIAV